ncbi:MAG: RND transporter, partial [Longimicrobiales bacterium]
MDKPRANPKRKRKPLYIGGGVVLAALITLGLSQLKPAPPGVERAAIWTDTVHRGPMVREVRGPGTLVPEDIWLIPAITAGRVDEIFARPGTQVQAGTPLLRLSNPDVQLQLLEAERQLR